jgi:bacteriocin biosynthesis cyclodehydratase domain-containing protein
MATALRVSQDPDITLVSLGEFGERVCDMLRAARLGHQPPGSPAPSGTKVAPGETERIFSSGRAPIVLALWRPSPEICDAFDTYAFRHNRVWFPVTAEGPVIRIGPVVAPPSGPCFGCYHRRRVQHDCSHAASSALRAAYDRDPGLGPRGYLPHHARTAAAIADLVLTSLGSEGGQAYRGQVITASQFGPVPAMDTVVRCHDCVRCEPDPRAAAAVPLRDLLHRASVLGSGALARTSGG